MTAITPITSGKSPAAGFTLIELMVVIVILALTAAVVLPRLPSGEATKLKSSARNLASGLRFLNDQAIITKDTYRLKLNVTDSSTSIVKLSSIGDELPPDDQFMNRRLIEEGISIEDVIVPRQGTVTEGEVIIPFGPGGSPDLVTIHLKGGDQHYTIIAYPSGGKVLVQTGYQEITS